MVTLFLRQGENGKQVLLSFPATTPAEKADVTATMEKLRSAIAADEAIHSPKPFALRGKDGP